MLGDFMRVCVIVMSYFSANLGVQNFFRGLQLSVCHLLLILGPKKPFPRSPFFPVIFLQTRVQQCAPTIVEAECSCFCWLICYHCFSVSEFGQRDQPVRSFTPGCHRGAPKGVLSGILDRMKKTENMISRLFAETSYCPICHSW